MPTAPILVDRTSVPAGQDIQAMEKLAKVGKGQFTVITTKMADSQGLVTTSKNRQSIESSPFIYGKCMKSCLGLYFCHRNFLKPAGKQPTFGDATAGLISHQMASEKRAQKFRTDPVLLPRSG